jgi:hypothetical protein
MSGGSNLIAPASDNSTSIEWGGFTVATGASSATDGATNTATIVNCLTNSTSGGCPGNIDINTYAAGICSTYSANGGYTSGWFLPAQTQLECLATNQASIGGFANAKYWASREQPEAPPYNGVAITFPAGGYSPDSKFVLYRVRCVNSFTP